MQSGSVSLPGDTKQYFCGSSIYLMSEHNESESQEKVNMYYTTLGSVQYILAGRNMILPLHDVRSELLLIRDANHTCRPIYDDLMAAAIVLRTAVRYCKLERRTDRYPSQHGTAQSRSWYVGGKKKLTFHLSSHRLRFVRCDSSPNLLLSSSFMRNFGIFGLPAT